METLIRELATFEGVEHAETDQHGTRYTQIVLAMRRRIGAGETTGDPVLDDLVFVRTRAILAFLTHAHLLRRHVTADPDTPCLVFYGPACNPVVGVTRGDGLIMSRLSQSMCIATKGYAYFDPVARAGRRIEGNIPLGGLALASVSAFARRVHIGIPSISGALSAMKEARTIGFGELVDVVLIGTTIPERRSADVSMRAAHGDASRRAAEDVARQMEMVSNFFGIA
jgi:hypothetical protein